MGMHTYRTAVSDASRFHGEPQQSKHPMHRSLEDPSRQARPPLLLRLLLVYGTGALCVVRYKVRRPSIGSDSDSGLGLGMGTDTDMGMELRWEWGWGWGLRWEDQGGGVVEKSRVRRRMLLLLRGGRV